jgi:hypothetical protein
MKKMFTLLCAGVLMSALCAAVVACNDGTEGPNNEEFPESGIKPALPLSAGETDSEADKEVTAFFDENAYLIGQAIIAQEYDNLGDFKFADKCVMINSAEKLPAINGYDDTPLKYPAIGFDTYTLIIGQYVAIHGGIYLRGQAVVAEPEAAIMNIRLGAFDGPHDDAIQLKGFWGLYPKIDAKTINMNITRKY